MLESPHRAKPRSTPIRSARFALPDVSDESIEPLPRVDVPAALWEGRNKVVAGVLVALMTAAIYLGFIVSPEYTARALIRITLAPTGDALPIEQRTGLSGRKIEIETERAVLLGTPVLQDVADRLALETRTLTGSSSRLRVAHPR